MDDVTGGQGEPKRPVVSRRRGLGKGLGAILPGPETVDEPSRPDELTGLPNRAMLDERFDETMARCREDGAALAVLVVALDGFGEVNELYGHSAGDNLLHEAAARLSASRRRSDTVARFAGDEFVLVCPYVASSDLACQMAGRILEDLSRPTRVDKVEVQLSASIGVVVTSPKDARGDAPTLETLLGDATLAMRRAKDEGGGSSKLFDPSMREDVVVRSQNRQDLRVALDEDGLLLEYEDIVDLESGVAISESAILVWSQPGPEVDQPQAPLDLVDEAGLAVPIGRWVLDQALSDLRVRHGALTLAAHFRVWVKVAPSLVADPALVTMIDELTAAHGFTPSVLGLDIREPSAAALGSTESNLRELHQRDVVVALDDFGSGQSNLGLLQRLPISGLKLAPDLVAALGEDTGAAEPGANHPAALEAEPDARAQTLSREAAALVRGLIELGRALELTVVAQGVESEAQVATLRALGCEYAQGPLLEGQAVVAVLSEVSDDPPEDDTELEDPPGLEVVEDDPGPVTPTESLWAPGTLTS
ncbi:MAG TPA: EAL domain-containing protein [Acidimicrobiales bacterium]|nr:EAL domain-containing protein [Acidimicrobiales bacterium]